ncbi:MAG TPA: alpha/beta hydrolase [Oligoflexia bacterium]|nr:alpha/beta hydrolase [Oligoflexia bacterium]
MNDPADNIQEEVKLGVLRLGREVGPVVVMLHGWGQTKENLRPLGELLAEFASVHLVDLPGFGDSTPPPGIWGTEEYAARILAYLDELDLRRVVLLGHSFGGKVALRFAAKHPERLEKLVLIASSGLRPHRAWRKRLRFFAISVLRCVVRFIEKYLRLPAYRKWFIARFASPDYKNAGLLRQTFVRVVNEDLAPFVARISTPALLLWGNEDTETPPETAERLHKLLRHSKLLVLPGRGHYPFFDSGLHLCAHYITDFLREGIADQENEGALDG